MKFVGITGGVGAGKSTVLDYLSSKDRILVKKADEIGRELTDNDIELRRKLKNLLGRDVIRDDGSTDRKKMAELIFKDPDLKEKVNALIHPAVREKILEERDRAAHSGNIDVFFIEAALLIEEGYDKICDELIFIYADRDIRIKRLISSRGYTEEKAESIINSQLPDETYKKYCRHIIDNSGSFENTIRETDRILSGYKS